MTELAEDLSVTKQALSYYFHDKPGLVNAVLERISKEYTESAKEVILHSSSVEEGLKSLTQLKSTFFEKYYMLFSQQHPAECLKDPFRMNWKQSLKNNELNLLVTLFEKGVKSGELKPLDAEKTAELLLETLRAFSNCVKENSAVPNANAFKEVLKRQHDVMKLFYEGLKRDSWLRQKTSSLKKEKN